MKALRMSAGIGLIGLAVALGLFSLAMVLAGFLGVDRGVAEKLGFRVNGLFGMMLSPFLFAAGRSVLRSAGGRKNAESMP